MKRVLLYVLAALLLASCSGINNGPAAHCDTSKFSFETSPVPFYQATDHTESQMFDRNSGANSNPVTYTRVASADQVLAFYKDYMIQRSWTQNDLVPREPGVLYFHLPNCCHYYELKVTT